MKDQTCYIKEDGKITTITSPAYNMDLDMILIFGTMTVLLPLMGLLIYSVSV